MKKNLQLPIQKEGSKERILEHATHITAAVGCHALSMRQLADEVQLTQSVIYHYFEDKEALLKAVYERANTLLGEARAQLSVKKSTKEKFNQLIHFQLQHAQLIVAVLRYYLYKREDFHQQNNGTLPEKAILHVEEVVQFGVQNKELKSANIAADSKVIAHAINGYLLEYYPYMPKGKTADELVDGMVNFIMRSLTTGNSK